MSICSVCGSSGPNEVEEDITNSLKRCPSCDAPINLPSSSQGPSSDSDHPLERTSQLSEIESVIPVSEIWPSETSQSTLEETQTMVQTEVQLVDGDQKIVKEEQEHTLDVVIHEEDDPLPSPEERAEASRKSLREKGFILEEDAHGLRLSGVASRRNKPHSELSPYDIVRLAAELEGGVLPLEKRKRCPKCDAVVSPGDKRCQWCSEPL